MIDIHKKIVDCIEECRIDGIDMTIKAVSGVFLDSLNEDETNSMRVEALQNLIVSKVRAAFKQLEATGSAQMQLAGVDCPTYICTPNDTGENHWIYTEDATLPQWHAWLELKRKNMGAVIESYSKDKELVDFISAIMGNSQTMTTKEAMAIYLKRGAT
jgi:hypothetical protein